MTDYVCGERNLEHAQNPKAGDYWHERLFPICIVVEVTDETVTIVEPDSKNDKFNEDNPVVMSREEFSNRYRYGRLSNHDFKATNKDETANKFWCDVRAERFKDYAKKYTAIKRKV